MKNRENTNVTINNATDREAYNGVPLKVGEALVPMVVDEQFLDLNAVSADKVRTWQMAGITVFCQALFPKKSVRIPCFQQGNFPAFGGYILSPKTSLDNGLSVSLRQLPQAHSSSPVTG